MSAGLHVRHTSPTGAQAVTTSDSGAVYCELVSSGVDPSIV